MSALVHSVDIFSTYRASRECSQEVSITQHTRPNMAEQIEAVPASLTVFGSDSCLCRFDFKE